MKNMKKLLSTILTFVLVLSMTTVAFAADDKEYTDMSTVTLSKTYKLENADTTSPEETFTFSKLTCTSVTDAAADVTTDNAPVPTIASVYYEKGEAGSETATKNITITLPTYTSVGVYTYTFKENDGGTAGVTYRDAEIKLVVTVIEQNGKVRVAAVHTEGSEEGKSNSFDNKYSAGSLAVSKKVTGILGDKKKDFGVTVTFKAPKGVTIKSDISYIDDDYNDETDDTKTITPDKWITDDKGDVTATVKIELRDGETVEFTNIPYNVTYTVVEDDYTGENGGYDKPAYEHIGKLEADGIKYTIDTNAEQLQIVNNKGGQVDTGIVMDSAPYIVLLAIVCVGFFGFVSKKRMMDEI